MESNKSSIENLKVLFIELADAINESNTCLLEQVVDLKNEVMSLQEKVETYRDKLESLEERLGLFEMGVMMHGTEKLLNGDDTGEEKEWAEEEEPMFVLDGDDFADEFCNTAEGDTFPDEKMEENFSGEQMDVVMHCPAEEPAQEQVRESEEQPSDPESVVVFFEQPSVQEVVEEELPEQESELESAEELPEQGSEPEFVQELPEQGSEPEFAQELPEQGSEPEFVQELPEQGSEPEFAQELPEQGSEPESAQELPEQKSEPESAVQKSVQESMQDLVLELKRKQMHGVVAEQPKEILAERPAVTDLFSHDVPAEQPGAVGPFVSAVQNNDEKKIIHDTVKPDWYDWEVDYPAPYMEDISEGIGFNDRLLFLRELFRGDETLFRNTVLEINAMSLFRDAVDYIRGRFPEWNEQSDEVYRFYMNVRRKLRK